jgi:hypothetical protein
MVELWVEALLSRPAVTVSGARPADERAWLMSASTWAAASLEVAPAGLEAGGEAEDGDDVGLDERAGLDGDEDDGAVEEDGDEEDDADEDGADEGPPATGCLRWARDGVGCADCGTDGLAVTTPNGWPAHGAALRAASTAGPMAPASAADAADPTAADPAPAWAGAQEAGAGRSVRVPDEAGAAGAFPLTR